MADQPAPHFKHRTFHHPKRSNLHLHHLFSTQLYEESALNFFFLSLWFALLPRWSSNSFHRNCPQLQSPSISRRQARGKGDRERERVIAAVSQRMDISNPRRILAVSLEGSEHHLSRVIKGMLFFFSHILARSRCVFCGVSAEERAFNLSRVYIVVTIYDPISEL